MHGESNIKKSSYTEFNEGPRNGLVDDTRPQTDRQTDRWTRDMQIMGIRLVFCTG
jgi:hypothetical protein